MNRTFSGIAFGTLFVSAAFAGNLTPPGGPVAPTMKTLDQIEPRKAVNATNTPGDADSMFRITQRGSYYLTNGFEPISGRKGIEINVSDVTLDLGGFRIGGAVSSTLDGIAVGAGFRNITIVNGTVFNWQGDGIDASAANDVRIINVTAIDNAGLGIRAGHASQITGCTATGNDAGGISAKDGSRVSDCVVSSTGPSGTIYGISVNFGSTVIGCTVRSTQGGNGISALSGSVIINCTATENQVGILSGHHCVIRDCNAVGNGIGIRGADRTTISNCNAGNNDLIGIEVANRCQVRDCTLDDNNTAILVTSDYNRIEGNHLGIGDVGIHVVSDAVGNVVIRNSLTPVPQPFVIWPGNVVGPIVNAANIATNQNPHANYLLN